MVEILGYVGLLVSFIYLYLEFKQKRSMWLFSIMCSMIYVCIYFSKQLYADMGFSCFNICMSVWGFMQWRHRLSDPKGSDVRESSRETKKKTPVIEYRRFSSREWVVVLCVTALVYIAIYTLLRYLTDSPVPARDAFNTTLNIIGTWVLGRRVIEVWGFWFLANVASVYLYYVRSVDYDMLPTILLYLFYTGASIYGFWRWKHYGVEVKTKEYV